MAFDSKLQRQIMGRFATGVTVVTLATDEGPWGMTANAVTSLSLDPPLVLVAVVRGNRTHARLLQAKSFAINILRADQEALSTAFAKDGQAAFVDSRYGTAVTGAPVFEASLGYVDCRLHEVLPGGDHDIFVGEIVAGEAREGAPLLFFGGRYAQLAPPAGA